MVLKEYIFTSRPDANIGGGYGTTKTTKNADRTGDGFPYSLRDYDLDELPEVWDDEEELDRFSTKVRNAYVTNDKFGSFVGDRSAFVKGSTRGLHGRAVESLVHEAIAPSFNNHIILRSDGSDEAAENIDFMDLWDSLQNELGAKVFSKTLDGWSVFDGPGRLGRKPTPEEKMRVQRVIQQLKKRDKIKHLTLVKNESVVGGRSHTGTATNPDIYITKPGRAIGTDRGWSSAPYPHMDDDDEPIFNLGDLAKKRWDSRQSIRKRARVEPPADGAYTTSDQDDDDGMDQEMLLRSVIRALV